MGVELTNAAYSALRGSTLDKTTRFVFVLLADAAKDATGLCWPSQAALAEVVGCAPNYLNTAMKALAAAGLISIWRRPGKVPLYLVHPGGRTMRRPCATGTIQKHLRQGAFTDIEISDALGWLNGRKELLDTPHRGFGGRSAQTPKVILGENAQNPQDGLATPPRLVLAHPQDHLGRTIKNPKEPKNARATHARPGASPDGGQGGDQGGDRRGWSKAPADAETLDRIAMANEVSALRASLAQRCRTPEAQQGPRRASGRG